MLGQKGKAWKYTDVNHSRTWYEGWYYSAHPGQTIVFEGEADQSPEVASGDIIFTIRTTPHESFKRIGSNLYLKHTITLKESLVGFTHQVIHLDGSAFKLKRSGLTPYGFVDTIIAKGMPKDLYSDDGDLYVEYNVLYPENLSAGQADWIKEHLQ